MITYEEAIDEIFSIFKINWEANSAAVVGYTPEVRWYGVEKPKTPPMDKFWARVSQQTVTDEQSTLRNGECTRYTTDGLVFVQLFCPKSDSEGMEKGRKLAMLARDAYRGNATSGKVWFRNARIKELSSKKDMYRLNVVAEYEYDEAKEA